MQYILDEAEYLELKQKQDVRIRASRDELQAICTLAAQHIPVARDWAQDKAPAPWGCILAPPSPGYCDDCPVTAICPHVGKRYSQ